MGIEVVPVTSKMAAFFMAIVCGSDSIDSFSGSAAGGASSIEHVICQIENGVSRLL